MNKMEITTKEHNGVSVAIIKSDELLIVDAQSALDLIATVRYETKCDCVAIFKNSITEDFFVLSKGLAGDVLQKFVNYGIKLAIIGDFSGYTSKPLQDFIYESNRGNSIFFVDTEESAMERLAGAADR